MHTSTWRAIKTQVYFRFQVDKRIGCAVNGGKVNIPSLHLKSQCKTQLKWRPGTYKVNIHHGIQPESPIRAYTHSNVPLPRSRYNSFCQANTSLHSQTKWGNCSKLFAYKLMKHCKVKLSWMLITNVMHNLLINVSLHLVGRDGGTWGTALRLYAKQRKVFTLQHNMYCSNMERNRSFFLFVCVQEGLSVMMTSDI